MTQITDKFGPSELVVVLRPKEQVGSSLWGVSGVGSRRDEEH